MKTLLYILALIPILTKAQEPKILGNLQQKGDYSTTYATNVGGQIFFKANDNTNGEELWKTDGTLAGTTMVKDIYAGASSSSPRDIISFNSFAFFSAYEGTNGTELWRSDGTNAGTVLVKDIITGSTGSYPERFTVAGATLFFSGNDGTTFGIYKTDGTTGGTVLVKDIYASSSSKAFSLFRALGNNLFFTVLDFTNNQTELWKSDGTLAGTVIVKTFVGYTIFNSIGFNGNLYFGANDGTGEQFWKSDGTLAGTVTVANYQGIYSFEILNGLLYFSSYQGLYKTDGTEAGTVLVSNLSANVYYLKAANGNLYFWYNNLLQEEFWKTDGTTNTLLKSFQRADNISNSQFLEVATNGTVFFGPEDNQYGEELWKTDGTVAGTVLVKDIRTGLYGSVPNGAATAILGNNLIFWASDGLTGFEPYKSDGTAGGTAIIKDISANVFDSNPSNFTKLNTYLLFSADSPYNTAQLYSSNASANPQLLPVYNTSNLLAFNNKVYFNGANSSYGNELFVSDGTYANTVLVKDIYSGATFSSSPANLTALGSNFLFAASTAAEGRELWKSDGTLAGTALVKDLVVGTGSSSPTNLTFVGTNVFFFAINASTNKELWKTDGTTANTTKLSAPIINTVSTTGVLNNEFYFNGASVSPNYELWKTNGSTATLVKEINTATLTGSYPTNFTTIGTTMYFQATNGTNGFELWKTDGTAAGTVMVNDINTGSNDSTPIFLYNFNNILYFNADDGINGRELWRSDGTLAGTFMLKNINTAGSSNPYSFCQVGNTLYFSATDGRHGTELWKTDGTSNGTVIVFDLYVDNNNNLNNANPTSLYNKDGTLFFAANQGTYGTEPYYFKTCEFATQSRSTYSLMPSQTLHTTQIITANNKFYPSRTVNYFAGSSISLTPGFRVSAGVGEANTFRAEIRGCN